PQGAQGRQRQLQRPSQALQERAADSAACWPLRLHPSAHQEARLPPVVDHAHQRRRPHLRALVQRAHLGPQASQRGSEPQDPGRPGGARHGGICQARGGREVGGGVNPVSSRDTLLQGLDASWSASDPAALLDSHGSRLAELRALDAALAEAYQKWAEALAGASDLKTLQERQVAVLGRERGVLKQALSELGKLPPEERRVRGAGLNTMRAGLEDVVKARRERIEKDAEVRAAAGLDVTLPGRRPWIGRPHVLAQVQADMLDLFHGLGFSV